MNSAFTKNNKLVTHALRAVPRWLDASIGHRITASALALTLTIGAAIGGGSYLVSRKILEDAIARELANETALAARQVGSTLNILHADLSRLSSIGTLVRALADLSVRDADLATFFKDYSGPARLSATLTLYDSLGRPINGTGNDTRTSY